MNNCEWVRVGVRERVCGGCVLCERLAAAVACACERLFVDSNGTAWRQGDATDVMFTGINQHNAVIFR